MGACVIYEDYLRLISYCGPSIADFKQLLASGTLDVRSHSQPRQVQPQRIGASVPQLDGLPSEAEHTCAICLQQMEMQDRVALLPCRHILHVGCMVDWRSNVRGLPYDCPICRTP